jgi:hypothetical protein
VAVVSTTLQEWRLIHSGALVQGSEGGCRKIKTFDNKKFTSVAKFIVPVLGDKNNSGIGLSHRRARLQRLAGRYDNPMPESTT